MSDSLRSLCARVEALAPGSIAGLTICNPGHTHIENALFPNLPFSFSAAITHVPLQPADFGSCVQAIARGEAITCADISNDTYFDPRWRQVCLDHGLRALQSRPVYVNGRESDWDAALMTFAADAAGEALGKEMAHGP